MKPPEFAVGPLCFRGGNPLIIAEIGTGHGGDPARAAELISAAKDSGADCVKFQHVYAQEIIHPRTGFVPLPGGPTPLYDRFRSLEKGPEFFAELKRRAEDAGLLFLCTPFGIRSARELSSIGVRAFKVASPELNHLELLEEIARTRLPTILSSGVSTLADIERAISRFQSPQGAGYVCSLALLHCVTSYPAPEEDYNLRILEPLSRLFGIPCGVSDHSRDPVLVPALSACLGAVVLEKHICLSRSDPGLDDPIALPPEDFLRMTRAVRGIAEAGAEASIEALALEYGRDRVEATLGDGRKRLAPSEKANYGRTNRSLHSVRTIQRGEVFTRDAMAALRTEKVLRPGLPPEFLERILGRTARREVPDGEGIEWEDIG